MWIEDRKTVEFVDAQQTMRCPREREHEKPLIERVSRWAIEEPKINEIVVERKEVLAPFGTNRLEDDIMVTNETELSQKNVDIQWGSEKLQLCL